MNESTHIALCSHTVKRSAPVCFEFANFSNIKFSFLCLLFLVCLILPFSQIAIAQDLLPKNFEHFKTGFPLTGAHASVSCEACHVTGSFKSTPKQCAGCHNNVIAIGKSPKHLPTNEPCENCHNATVSIFQVEGGFDHAGITAPCASCHNGVKQTGKSASHIKTSEACGACHAVRYWQPAMRVDHNEVQGTCSSCHDNTTARGKEANHVQTLQECNVCHQSTRDWSVTGYDHTGVTGNCASCHGVTATGKNAAHIASSNTCEACHASTSVWLPVAKVDHEHVQGACTSCHNGAVAQGQGKNHIDTKQECSLCHTTQSEWQNASFDHDGINANCSQCHNGTQASGKGLIHIATTNKCEACHAPVGWKLIKAVDHTQVSGACSSCHDNKVATGKGAKHVQTTQECNVCHKSTADWSAATFDHAGVTGTCVSCHNGARATGKGASHITSTNRCESCHVPTGGWTAQIDHAQVQGSCSSCHAGDKDIKHISVPAGSECSLCHTSKSWLPASGFSHGLVTNVSCETCHNGNFPAAPSKSASHAITPPGVGCGTCHKSTSDFTVNVVFDHVMVAGTCATCHLTDKAPNHIPTPPATDCVACHSIPPALWSPAATFNHSLVTTLRCDACHNGNFISAQAPGKHPGHVATPPAADCNACHKSTMDFIASVAFDHAMVTGSCASCHLVDKAASHIPVPAGTDCVACHGKPPALWSPATAFNHSIVSTLRCDACHNGNFLSAQAPGKSASHVPTPPGMDCGACHKSMMDFAANVAFDHSAIVTGCSACHQKDKVASHIPVPAGTDCGVCHNKPPAFWAQATLFKHTSVTAQRCDACHNGGYAVARGKHPSHVATAAGLDCGACHKSTLDFTANVTFDHSAITAACVSCHAPDKPANHIPLPANTDCGACHTTPPAMWSSATRFSHSLVTSIACGACHNGSFVGANALGQPSTHFQTTRNCDACHVTTSWTTVTRFVHTSPNYPGDHNPTVTCSDCHTSNSQVIAWPSAALKPFCGGCHQNNFKPGPHKKTESPETRYTLQELKNCAGACHIYTNSTLTTIKERRDSEHRVRDSQF